MPLYSWCKWKLSTSLFIAFRTSEEDKQHAAIPSIFYIHTIYHNQSIQKIFENLKIRPLGKVIRMSSAQKYFEDIKSYLSISFVISNVIIKTNSNHFWNHHVSVPIIFRECGLMQVKSRGEKKAGINLAWSPCTKNKFYQTKEFLQIWSSVFTYQNIQLL